VTEVLSTVVEIYYC